MLFAEFAHPGQLGFGGQHPLLEDVAVHHSSRQLLLHFLQVEEDLGTLLVAAQLVDCRQLVHLLQLLGLARE